MHQESKKENHKSKPTENWSEQHREEQNNNLDNSWLWTIFMVLGIAFITFTVFYVGIYLGWYRGFSEAPINDLPSFIFDKEFHYFGVLIPFIILSVIIVQNRKIEGYKIVMIFLGFECAVFFLYDWGWWFMELGWGRADFEQLWGWNFHAPFLIDRPPMLLFFLISILGLIMSVYTFTIPKNYLELLPSMVWFYAIVLNPTLCSFIGLNTTVILCIGIPLIVAAFGSSIYFTYRKIHSMKTKKISKRGIIIIVAIGLIILTYSFLLIYPFIGYLLGLGIWFVFPITFLIRKIILEQKQKRKIKEKK